MPRISVEIYQLNIYNNKEYDINICFIEQIILIKLS